jgi:hypothetical protein
MSVLPSVCLSTYICAAPTGGIFVKLILGTLATKVCRETLNLVKTKQYQSLYTVTYTFVDVIAYGRNTHKQL